MGLGHVPPGPLRQAGESDDVSRRQHRGAGADLDHLIRRPDVARSGEAIAAAFLERRGAAILGRNIGVGRGEIDLIVRERGVLVAVEVKTIGPGAIGAEPIDRIDDRKLRQVRRLAARSMIGRVDFVGVRLEPHGAVVNWRTAVA